MFRFVDIYVENAQNAHSQYIDVATSPSRLATVVERDMYIVYGELSEAVLPVGQGRAVADTELVPNVMRTNCRGSLAGICAKLCLLPTFT